LGIAPKFSFYELPEIHQEAPAPYYAAMREIRIREEILGPQYYKDMAILAHAFFELKRPWWL
jgi:hypothetical protein